MFRVVVDINDNKQVTIKDFGTENSLKTYLDEIDFSEVITMTVTYHNSSPIIFD